MTRPIGLHVRCNERLKDIIDKAIRLNLESFQCFLRRPDGTLLKPEPQEIAEFNLFRQQCKQLYAHASYKINLADPQMPTHPALRDEINLALTLGFTHIIIHPGAAQDPQQGFSSLIKHLNKLTKKTHGITILLENIAFGAPSLGGNIEDLVYIIERLERPESVGVCIDTAHAYAYGYDLAQDYGLNQFIDLLQNSLGAQKINLIHINDTQTQLGSRHDIHSRIGQGNIGIQYLKKMVLSPKLAHIPLICELPTLPEEQEKEDLELVRLWHQAEPI